LARFALVFFCLQRFSAAARLPVFFGWVVGAGGPLGAATGAVDPPEGGVTGGITGGGSATVRVSAQPVISKPTAPS